MNVPPMILDLKIASPEKNPIHLWLPLFLLWPFVLVLVVISLVFTILADVVLLLLGQRYHYYTFLLVGSLGLLNQMHGLVVRINDGQTAVDVTVQ